MKKLLPADHAKRAKTRSELKEKNADGLNKIGTSILGNSYVHSRNHPKTRKKLDRLGSKIIEMDVSEVRKMDGGLTCLLLRF